MSGFDFNIDNELAGIRKRPGAGGGRPASQPAPPPAEARKVPPLVVPETPEPAPEPESAAPEPEGFGISQGHQESNNGSSAKKPFEPVNWKGFKTLPGVFERVGGDRPVILKEPINRVQATGMPEALILAIQNRLQEKYSGQVVDFPWGSHTISLQNRVFTTRSTLLRYLMFDSLRDGKGSQVQYAMQWLVSHIPSAFDVNFKPNHLKQASDELDIYALLLVANQLEGKPSEANYQSVEKLDLVSDNVMRILSKLADQEIAFEAYTERNATLQTVVLLDRMGLLRGGLPKDVDAFIAVLEQNRGEIASMSKTVDAHVIAENEYKRAMLREEQLRAYRSR